VNGEPRDLDRAAQCVCAHDASAHNAQSGHCSGTHLDGASRCSCAQYEPLEDISPLERVKIIRAQLLALREIFDEAQRRGLVPEEEAAFRMIAAAFAELNQTWREVFGE
jgi:hypothetical protein